jgi:wyosine [tRNA(Phe)-imidazoG37] synthetase (radical SAM superfamily)
MYTFGPVNSRRFGLSLGIDLSPNEKSCNFDCLYCELKASKPIETQTNVPNVEDIVSEVKQSLEKYPNVDVITITSNGEPTLYPLLDKLVKSLNQIKNDKKLLILSNGSTIDKLKVQKILKNIDIVKLSLDCVSQKCFKKLDRPHKSIKLDDIISGMIKFNQTFKNELVIEILVVKNLNDNLEEFEALNDALQDINPNRIDIGTIDRPSAYDVQKVDFETLNNLATLIQKIPLSVVSSTKINKKLDFSKEQILETIKRRPISKIDVEQTFSLNSKQNLEKLCKKDEIITKTISNLTFYCI